MKKTNAELYFLLALLLGVLALAFLIFKPFLTVLALALVFATVFYPVHTKALAVTGGRNAIAALLSTLTVLVVVILPLTVLGIQILRESTELYTVLVAQGGASEFSRVISETFARYDVFTGLLPVPDTLGQYVTQGLGWLLGHLGSLFASIAKALLNVFLFLLALYYLFKDGRAFKSAVIALSPLQDVHDETIVRKLSLAINSVIRGSLTIAVIQGVLTAVGFALFGVPNPTLWGSVAAIAALIPGVGTALVIVPAVLYLYVTGDAAYAGGLLAWGIVAVGLVDNLLGPKLVERGVRFHSFLILLSILGGLSFFGPLGFLLGPLVLSLLFALLDIHSAVRKEHESL